MRKQWLYLILKWLAVVMLLRVTLLIVLNYSDYFPPNFNSLFLENRESTFYGIYSVAFYLHLFSAPFVLLNGLVLMSDRFRNRSRRLHRRLGKLQVLILLGLMLPSSIIMACDSFAGWPAGLSFLTLSILTGYCTIAGFLAAKSYRFTKHRRWMSRCYVLLCSAIFLRILSGGLMSMGVEDPEVAYIIASWASWIIPSLAFEIYHQLYR